jgi:hypothetical protein
MLEKLSFCSQEINEETLSVLRTFLSIYVITSWSIGIVAKFKDILFLIYLMHNDILMRCVTTSTSMLCKYL